MEDGNFSEIVPGMMKKVNPKLITIVTYKSSDQESMDEPLEKVFGYSHNPLEDKPRMSFTFNPASKSKGAKICPDLSLADVEGFIKIPQSRRCLLATCNAVYIPLGLVTPLPTKLKVLLKESLSHNCVGDWDPPASTSLIKEQADKLKEIPPYHPQLHKDLDGFTTTFLYIVA